MQGRRGARGAMTPLSDFGDPFGVFGAAFGGFGNRGSLLSSSLFGGRDPFDDPFFMSPFGGGGLFGSSLIGSPFADMHPFPGMHPSAFNEHQDSEPTSRRGPIIEELSSDDEKKKVDEKNKENPRKHGRSSKEPIVDLDDENDEAEGDGRKNKQLQYRNGHNKRFNNMEQQPQTHSFTFQSSTVTYGGANGAYHTSSKTRRIGSDGVTFEESKEADSSTRQATHKISRGIHNKGHTFTRKLNSDGKVDTMQTLHNLHEDELAGFEEAWNGNARQHLPGWSGNFNGHDNIGASAQARQGGWALPSAERAQQLHRAAAAADAGNRAGSSRMQHSGRTGGSSHVKENSGYAQGPGKRSS